MGSEEHQARQAQLPKPFSCLCRSRLTSPRLVLEVLGLQGSPQVGWGYALGGVPSVRPLLEPAGVGHPTFAQLSCGHVGYKCRNCGLSLSLASVRGLCWISMGGSRNAFGIFQPPLPLCSQISQQPVAQGLYFSIWLFQFFAQRLRVIPYSSCPTPRPISLSEFSACAAGCSRCARVLCSAQVLWKQRHPVQCGKELKPRFSGLRRTGKSKTMSDFPRRECASITRGVAAWSSEGRLHREEDVGVVPNDSPL